LEHRTSFAESSSKELNEEFPVIAHRYSVATMERSIATKIYFEHYFDRLFSAKSNSPNSGLSRTRRKIEVEQELDKIGLSDYEKTKIRDDWIKRERAATRLSREKITIDKFEPIRPIGKGAFGLVQLVREKTTNIVYAMKILKKEDMINNKHESHVRAERDMLRLFN
jgi:hypothetical protein